MARVAGGLLGRTGAHNTVDALVAAAALASGGDVLTSDPDDLAKLLSGHSHVTVLEI
jgi:hypothetical protein